MARNYTNLSNIVNNFLALQSESDYTKGVNANQLMLIGKEFIRQHVAPKVGGYLASVRIPIDKDLYTAELPNDYLAYTKIGVLDEHGRVQILGKSNKINISGDYILDSSGNKLLDSFGRELLSESEFQTSVDDGSVNLGDCFYGYSYGNMYGKLYGVETGNNKRGYYRINEADNRIDFGTEIAYDYIILEYVADASMVDDPKLPRVVEEAARLYLYMRIVEFKQNVPANHKLVAQRNFYNALREANFRKVLPTKGEIAQQINRRNQATPKILYE